MRRPPSNDPDTAEKASAKDSKIAETVEHLMMAEMKLMQHAARPNAVARCCGMSVNLFGLGSVCTPTILEPPFPCLS